MGFSKCTLTAYILYYIDGFVRFGKYDTTVYVIQTFQNYNNLNYYAHGFYLKDCI